MHLSHFLLLAGATISLATSAVHENGCCCCDISRNAIVCNPDQPAEDCFCAMVICPSDASTIIETVPTPTPEPTPPAEAPFVGKRYQEVSRPPPPPGMDWCCCCNGKDHLCAARPAGEICICTAIACPEDAQTIYPPGTRPERPGRPEPREKPGRPVRPDRPTS